MKELNQCLLQLTQQISKYIFSPIYFCSELKLEPVQLHIYQSINQSILYVYIYIYIFVQSSGMQSFSYHGVVMWNSLPINASPFLLLTQSFSLFYSQHNDPFACTISIHSGTIYSIIPQFSSISSVYYVLLSLRGAYRIASRARGFPR